MRVSRRTVWRVFRWPRCGANLEALRRAATATAAAALAAESRCSLPLSAVLGIPQRALQILRAIGLGQPVYERSRMISTGLTTPALGEFEKLHSEPADVVRYKLGAK